jgi:hypothetical protein
VIEFNGQRWNVTGCRLGASLPLHHQTLPEAWWSLDVEAQPGNGRSDCESNLHLVAQPLFFTARHWRELEAMELRVDPVWQDAHEFVNDDGEVQWTEAAVRWWPDRSVNRARYWLGDDFTIRFGSWDRERLICEFEGMLEAEEDYHIDPPNVRPDSKLNRQPPATLLLMAQAVFSQCEIEVPADVPEPIEWARLKAARLLGLDAFSSTQVRMVGGGPEGSDCEPLRCWKVTLTPLLRGIAYPP